MLAGRGGRGLQGCCRLLIGHGLLGCSGLIGRGHGVLHLHGPEGPHPPQVGGGDGQAEVHGWGGAHRPNSLDGGGGQDGWADAAGRIGAAAVRCFFLG